MGFKYRLGLEGAIEMVKDPLAPVPTGMMIFALADGWIFRRLHERMLDGVPEAHRRRLRELTETPVDRDALLRLPEDTLGHRFVHYMGGHGYDLDGWHIEYPRLNDLLREHWLLRRFVKVHDMMHLLLGFEVTPEGELGMQAFHTMNFREPFGVLAMASLPLVVLRHGKPVDMVRQLARGGRAGVHVDNLLLSPLEDMFGEDLVEVRRRLHIPPGGVP